MLSIYKIKNSPSEVKHVALLLLMYALWVFITGLYFGYQSNFENSKEIIRVLGRSFIFIYIAWYLLSLTQASWWSAVIFSGALTFFGFVAIVMLTYASLSTDQNDDLIKTLVPLLPALYFLSHAFFILLKSNVRSIFFTDVSKNA